MGHHLPVAYVGYEHFDLVNGEEPAMEEYHTLLRKVVDSEK